MQWPIEALDPDELRLVLAVVDPRVDRQVPAETLANEDRQSASIWPPTWTTGGDDAVTVAPTAAQRREPDHVPHARSRSGGDAVTLSALFEVLVRRSRRVP